MSTVDDAAKELPGLGAWPLPVLPPELRQIRPGVWVHDRGYVEAIHAHITVEYHVHVWDVEEYHSKMGINQKSTYLVCRHVDQDGMRCGVAMFWGSGGTMFGARGYATPGSEG